jgi:hypothetical protein
VTTGRATSAAAAATGNIGRHIVGFARLLRRAGMRVGTGAALDALDAAVAVGVAARADLYWALASTLVQRREDMPLFAEAFELWFRDPDARSLALANLLASARVPGGPRAEASRRLADALARPGHGASRAARSPEEERVELDVTMSASSAEALRTRDFEKMSAREIEAAKEAIAAMDLPRFAVPTRRLAVEPRGRRIDLRRSLRQSLRSGGRDLQLVLCDRAERPPPIVALCDVSGSMDRYSRIVIHFLHTLVAARERVSCFTFGTRLTAITRWLRARDPDEALALVGRGVHDWSGGTRIGASLRAFNKGWARRVLAQGAIVLLVTDG